MASDQRFTKATAAALGVLTVAWLAFLPWLSPVDRLLAMNPWPSQNRFVQFGTLADLLLSPWLFAVLNVWLVLWCWRERQRSLAKAVALGFAITTILGLLVRWWHPGEVAISMMMLWATSLAVALVVVAVQLRIDHSSVSLIRATLFCWIMMLGLNLWFLDKANISHLMAATLIACFSQVFAAIWFGMRLRLASIPEVRERKTVIIYNPIKVPRLTRVRRQVNVIVAEHGFSEPTWVATSSKDSGFLAAHKARQANADQVLVIGGDGTTRAVFAALAGSDLPVGLIPTGTGNLLALNLAIPFDQERAIRTALSVPAKAIDLIAVQAKDADHLEACLVMAGLGADARTLMDTSARAKSWFRAWAYVWAGLRNLRPRPNQAQISVDGENHSCYPSLLLVGNVSKWQFPLTVLPEAKPDNGEMGLLIASPTKTSETIGLGMAILRGKSHRCMKRLQGKEISIRLTNPEPFQVDGDVIGESDELEFRVYPASCLLSYPAASTKASTLLEQDAPSAEESPETSTLEVEDESSVAEADQPKTEGEPKDEPQAQDEPKTEGEPAVGDEPHTEIDSSVVAELDESAVAGELQEDAEPAGAGEPESEDESVAAPKPEDGVALSPEDGVADEPSAVKPHELAAQIDEPAVGIEDQAKTDSASQPAADAQPDAQPVEEPTLKVTPPLKATSAGQSPKKPSFKGKKRTRNHRRRR